MKPTLIALFAFIVATATVSRSDDVSCGNEGQPEPKDPCLGSVGANPINPLMGNLHREVTDLETFGFAAIQFTRIYNSRTTNFNAPYWDFGYKQTWQHNWNYEVRDLASKTFSLKDVKVRYPDGSDYSFKASDASGTVRVPTAENGDRLYPWSGSPYGFTLVTADGLKLDFQRTTSPKYRLVRARNGRGTTWNFSYDSGGLLRRIANEFGRWIEIERTSIEGVLCITRVRSHDGREVTYEYAPWTPTSSVVLSAVHYPGGETARYTYVGALTPATGRPLLGSASDPMYGGAGARVRYVYNYDMVFDFGDGPYLVTGIAKEERNLVSDALIVSLPQGTGADVPVIDGAGTETRRRFTNGLVTEQRGAIGGTTSFTRSADGYGYIASSTDALGATTTFERDYAGRVTREVDALGGVRTYSYNAAGYLVSETDPLGRTTSTTRNADNQPTRVDHPDGTHEAWTYNAFGQPTTHRHRDGGVVSYNYFAAGDSGGMPQDLESVASAGGSITRFTHTASGRVATTTDPLGRTTTSVYDWRGQLTQTTHPDETVVSQLWDDYGNRVAVVDELLRATVWTYNEFNQVASTTDPSNRTTRFEYGSQPGCSSCGYQATVTRQILPSGRELFHAYDERGNRINSTAAPGTALAASTTFAYDAIGRCISTTDAIGGTTLTNYDLLGRRISQTDPLGQVTEWTYDAAGNRLTEKLDDGATSQFGYDAANRVVVATDPTGATMHYAYDLEGLTTASDTTTRLQGAGCPGTPSRNRVA